MPDRRRLPQIAPVAGDLVNVRLRAQALGRSGDEGNDANIGVIARDAAFFPVLCNQMADANIARYLHRVVVRYALPGIHALNVHLVGCWKSGRAVSYSWLFSRREKGQRSGPAFRRSAGSDA